MKLFVFPTPPNATCTLTPDPTATPISGVQDIHPTGRPGQSFTLPTNLPGSNGAQLSITADGYAPVLLRGILELNPQVGLIVDDFHLQSTILPIRDITRPIWDGTYLRHPDGRRYVARHMSGFLDYKLWLDGGPAALGAIYQQAYDLGVRGRRVFPHIVNIVDFNPDSYGQRYWDELLPFLAFAAQYGQEIDFAVLSDTGYRGWPLSKCQDFWNHFAGIVNGQCWLSLTNEYDHGGNLVGTPNDYNRPTDPLVSQGSAVSDAPPPRPGWGSREFHVQKGFPKIGLAEDMYFNRIGFDADGSQWGPVLPTRLTEGPRFSEDTSTYTPWLAQCLASQSIAFGDGMTFHSEGGKVSKLLGPNQAACCAAAMKILASVEI